MVSEEVLGSTAFCFNEGIHSHANSSFSNIQVNSLSWHLWLAFINCERKSFWGLEVDRSAVRADTQVSAWSILQSPCTDS